MTNSLLIDQLGNLPLEESASLPSVEFTGLVNSLIILLLLSLKLFKTLKNQLEKLVLTDE